MTDETKVRRPGWAPTKSERPRCGARCRSGKACMAPVWKRADGTLAKRCRMHGGLSTGPKTEEGINRSRAGSRAWHALRRARQAPIPPHKGQP